MNLTEIARRGADLARGRTYAPPAQLPPVGPPPAAEVLLLGALLWPRPDVDPRPVLALVAQDDVADPALAQLLGVIRAMLDAGQLVGPVTVLDQLRRNGQGRPPMSDRLLQATTSGAVPEALRGYACAVVAASLRRRVESGAVALTEAVETAHEAELAPLVQRVAAGVTACAGRLDNLRGGEC